MPRPLAAYTLDGCTLSTRLYSASACRAPGRGSAAARAGACAAGSGTQRRPTGARAACACRLGDAPTAPGEAWHNSAPALPAPPTCPGYGPGYAPGYPTLSSALRALSRSSGFRPAGMVRRHSRASASAPYASGWVGGVEEGTSSGVGGWVVVQGCTGTANQAQKRAVRVLRGGVQQESSGVGGCLAGWLGGWACEPLATPVLPLHCTLPIPAPPPVPGLR